MTDPRTPTEAHARAALRRIWQRLAARPDAAVLERMRAHGFWDGADPAIGGAAVEPASRAAQAPSPPASPARDHLHLGVGVSAALGRTGSDTARLATRGFPVLHDAADVARALGLDLATLRWLTFHRRGATRVHYHRYDVPKKSGGLRTISAPHATLKAAQHWVLQHVLERAHVSPHAHGFVVAHSVVTNARPHVRRAVVVNLDLKDFFPSIGFRRVRGLFASLGYAGEVATVLALLCTEPPRVAVRIDGDPGARVVHVALGDRQLPQGAPTSPALTNLLCTRLDARAAGIARALGFSYTRYADDLTFSGDDTARVPELLARVRRLLRAEGFAENADKTRVMRRGRRQEVTGVVVNDRPTVSRDEVRRLRAILHNAARHGFERENREGHPAFVRHLEGKIAWVKMVDPRRGAQLSLMLMRALAAQASTAPGTRGEG